MGSQRDITFIDHASGFVGELDGEGILGARLDESCAVFSERIGARRPLIALSRCERGKRNSGDDAHESVPSRYRCC